jgi:hypothetical protein
MLAGRRLGRRLCSMLAAGPRCLLLARSAAGRCCRAPPSTSSILPTTTSSLVLPPPLPIVTPLTPPRTVL